MKRAPHLSAWLLLGVSIFLPQSGNAQHAMHPDYPKIPADQATPVLTMSGGVYAGKVAMPWRLYVPAVASGGKLLPLVVGLHGAGRRGEDNVGPMTLFGSFYSPEAQKKHPAFVLAPQIRAGRAWAQSGPKFTNTDVDAMPETDEMQTLFALVEKTIKENPIDPNRVYLVGQSMGGFGTWDAIVRRPDLWAAAVPICGGGDPSKAEIMKTIPIWAWHGSNDTTVQPENSRAIIEAIKKAGGSPKYSEPKAGHGSWNNAFADPELYDWLFQQGKPQG